MKRDTVWYCQGCQESTLQQVVVSWLYVTVERKEKRKRTFTRQVNICINKLVTSVGERLSNLGYFLFFSSFETILAKWAIISWLLMKDYFLAWILFGLMFLCDLYYVKKKKNNLFQEFSASCLKCYSKRLFNFLFLSHVYWLFPWRV